MLLIWLLLPFVPFYKHHLSGSLSESRSMDITEFAKCVHLVRSTVHSPLNKYIYFKFSFVSKQQALERMVLLMPPLYSKHKDCIHAALDDTVMKALYSSFHSHTSSSLVNSLRSHVSSGLNSWEKPIVLRSRWGGDIRGFVSIHFFFLRLNEIHLAKRSTRLARISFKIIILVELSMDSLPF